MRAQARYLGPHINHAGRRGHVERYGGGGCRHGGRRRRRDPRGHHRRFAEVGVVGASLGRRRPVRFLASGSSRACPAAAATTTSTDSSSLPRPLRLLPLLALRMVMALPRMSAARRRKQGCRRSRMGLVGRALAPWGLGHVASAARSTAAEVGACRQLLRKVRRRAYPRAPRRRRGGRVALLLPTRTDLLFLLRASRRRTRPRGAAGDHGSLRRGRGCTSLFRGASPSCAMPGAVWWYLNVVPMHLCQSPGGPTVPAQLRMLRARIADRDVATTILAGDADFVDPARGGSRCDGVSLSTPPSLLRRYSTISFRSSRRPCRDR